MWLWAVIGIAVSLLLVLPLLVFLVMRKVRKVRQERTENEVDTRVRHRPTVTDRDGKAKVWAPRTAHHDQRVRSSREKEKNSLKKKKKAKEADKKRRREPLGEDAIKMR